MKPGNAYNLEEEESLIRQCLAGSREAYSVLVERYQNMVYNIAFRMLGDPEAAKDAAQDSFISAYTGLKGFRGSARFSSWLCGIAINKCRDYIRARKSHVSLDEAPELACTGADPEENVTRARTLERLQTALDLLPTDYREVIVLKHVEGMSYREMAEILGVEENLLKVRTHRARETLRKILEKMEPQGG